MKRLILLLLLIGATCMTQAQNRYEERFTRPLDEVLKEVEARFDVKLNIDGRTEGLMVPYADFRIRPYSVEETLYGILGLFDMTFSNGFTEDGKLIDRKMTYDEYLESQKPQQ
mgnify:CR=1 FL=1